MKKLITICFFMAISFNVIAQNILSGTLGSYSYNNVCNKYTNLNWEVSYKFEKRTDGIYLIYNNPKVTVAQNSLYATAEKNYSKQELGLSAWPQSYTPSSLNVSVNCRLPNGKVELSGATFSSSDPYRTYEDWVCSTTLNGQEVNLSAFNLSVTKASYNPQPVREIDDIINQKKSKASTSYTSNSQNSESKNPLEASQSSTTQTNSQIPSLESQYAKLGIPANTPTYSKQEVTNQLVTQAGSLAGELLNDWADNIERKRAAEENEKERIIKSKEDYFENTYLNPLINKADDGDEIARMTLCFASKYIFGYYSDEYKKWDKWLATAAKNNNFDAMLEIANIPNRQGAIKILEEAATLGSVDAMVKLADYYNNKTTKCGGEQFIGGENPEKAFEWYEKAALKGSPVAMYRLGMIYKYSLTHDKDKYNYCAHSKKVHVKYNVVKDELKAFEWFSKSINPNYKESLFSTSKNNDATYQGSGNVYARAKASFFHPNSFLELAIFYSSGTVIPKDNEMAKKLKMYYNEYVNINKF